MKVLNGLKSVLSIYQLYGTCYIMSYYSILQNPVQINEYRQSWVFFNVSTVMYCSAALILIAGFLHAFSFIQTDQQHMFTASNLSKYYIQKTLRFLPLVIMTMFLAIFIMPFLGSGPIWQLYDK